MVEKLTDSNLELEEKMVTMASELSDLEALRDCYEELEEERMATERELREVGWVVWLGLGVVGWGILGWGWEIADCRMGDCGVGVVG